MPYPRDLHGYGGKPPEVMWPQAAALAVQFVINYEEGGENCLLHGDAASEAFLSEISGATAWPGQRHWNMESIYEYGARAGFWRLHRLFQDYDIPVTVYGVATALARSPAQVDAMLQADWEIASHGLKWIDYKDFPIEEERRHLHEAIRLHHAVTGNRPAGWYTGRCSINTVDLAAREGGFEYIADSYADDLPYWHETSGKPQLIVPYTLDANDMRFAIPGGFSNGDQFLSYLKDSFDLLYAEGLKGAPKMMSIGLHCRLAGRPGRAMALAKFLEYARSHDHVWFARRIDIARHWRTHHPPPKTGGVHRLSRTSFIDRFGDIFEHGSWIAERAYDTGLGCANDTLLGLHAAFCQQFRLASDAERLQILKAHPDLAGKLASRGELTRYSTHEQQGAGLDQLSRDELAKFTKLNHAYRDKFGFPFIIAVKGLDKDAIVQRFDERLANAAAAERATACAEVEKIAYLRLQNFFEDGLQTE